YKGADWLSVAVLECNGIKYKDLQDTIKLLKTFLAENSINIVAKGDYDLDYNVALAKHAKAAGLDIYINLYFSDS
ncbi:hypothetical protein F5883DRAFT_435968, partial [Diaporthe sp. PMI_573]